MALKEHTRKDLELKFRNVHALIKTIGQYLTLHGLTRVRQGKGTRPMTIWLVLWNLFPSQSEKLIDILSEINLFSLNMDGSTDDIVTEQETIFIRTCVQGKNYEIDSESECEQSEDETFRNVNKFVEIE